MVENNLLVWWVSFAVSLIPLLNWITLLIAGFVIAQHLAVIATQNANLLTSQRELHQLINSRMDKLLADTERVAHAAGRLEGVAAGLLEARERATTTRQKDSQ